VLEFCKPTEQSIRFIADNMRDEDVKEVWASNRYTPFEALDSSVEASDFSTVVVIDGVPCSVFGLLVSDILTGTGVPWLLSSSEILKHKSELLRQSPRIISEMLTISPKLNNYVHTENKVSIQWLQWLGFKVEAAIPYGRDGEMFHYFHLSRGLN
jgi:hypothetical protein